MTTLEDLKAYCKGKKIIIVGNCSDLLNEHGAANNAKLIDSYDIVVRINRGYHYKQQLYDNYIGSKTSILSLGVQTAQQAYIIVGGNSVDYILSPIIYSENLDYSNVYDISKDTYDTLKKLLDNNKPSTGISTYNFFNRFIDFERLDLIGFDFFESSVRQRNQLGHTKVSDHNGNKELAFFKDSCDPEKTKLYKLSKTNNHSRLRTNIPIHNTDNQFFFKNNNRR
tara:strand:- start:2448 stop:3122 length:675 start_codon:yes stop_codon:yes gene_type:complete